MALAGPQPRDENLGLLQSGATATWRAPPGEPCRHSWRHRIGPTPADEARSFPGSGFFPNAVVPSVVAKSLSAVARPRAGSTALPRVGRLRLVGDWQLARLLRLVRVLTICSRLARRIPGLPVLLLILLLLLT